MALLRKDMKLGFLAGGAILVLGVGYFLVSGIFGTEEPPTDPLAFDPGAELTAPGEPLAAAETPPPAKSPADEWGALVTNSPTPADLANGVLPEQAPVEPETPDINQVEPPFLVDATLSATGQQSRNPQPGTGQPAAPTTPVRTHKVASGENLSTIALKYYGDANLFTVLQNANPGINAVGLQIGQVINVPERTANDNAASTPVADAQPAGATEDGEGVHVVRSGETLSSIANKRFGRAALWKEIYELNKGVIGDNPAALKIGMKLKLPK